MDDIYSVLETKDGWSKAVNDKFQETLGETLTTRLGEGVDPPRKTLRMSSIGQPCQRKLWYSINSKNEDTLPSPDNLLKFLYGDVLEDLLLSLAEAAGHTVEGYQDTMEVLGIKGHRDAVIDGVTIDVKSASNFAFEKFRNHDLEKEDPYGYLTQLASYTYAAKDDPLVKDKDGGAFLAINKVTGELVLDYYDFKSMGLLDEVPSLYTHRKELVKEVVPPPQGHKTVKDGTSGNMKLDKPCVWCPYKQECWKKLRVFEYSNKYEPYKYFTKVVREPRVKEIK